MNFRIARKVLKSLEHKVAADNFGDIQVKCPRYTRQHIARATTRCNRQQHTANKFITYWERLCAMEDAGIGVGGSVPKPARVNLKTCQKTFRVIPAPGYA